MVGAAGWPVQVLVLAIYDIFGTYGTYYFRVPPSLDLLSPLVTFKEWPVLSPCQADASPTGYNERYDQQMEMVM